MLNMGQAGVATAAVIVAAVAVAGGAVGTPVAVDEVDVQPDSPFYGLEKAGETIKEATYAGGQSWNLARAQERTNEFREMAKKGKANEFTGLLNRAGDRLSKAAKGSANENGLERARKAIEKHLRVLENVKENVPEQAKTAISLAISRSSKGKAVVTSVAASVATGKPGGKKLGENLKENLRNQLKEVKRETERLRKRVRENREKGISENELVVSIELATAKGLTERVRQMGKENKSEAVSEISREVQARINAAYSAAVDNEGLNQAIQASQKHLSVLENVKEKVPEQAKNAIQNAIRRSQTHVEVLRNMKGQGKPTPGNINKITENIIEQIPETVENWEQQVKDLMPGQWSQQENQEQAQEGQENQEQSQGDQGKVPF